jgi:membrane fusion protein, multidrug efflux system
MIACASLAGTFALTSCGPKQPAGNAAMMAMMAQVPVRAVPAVATDVPLIASAVGNVEAMASVDVKSRVAGQILRVYFQDGQDVKQGDVLFEIDPEPLQRQIAQTEADIAKDLALEAQAKADVARDEAQQKQTRASADRALELSKEGIFSKEQTEQSVASADAAQASLQADRAAVESAAAASKADRARLAQTELQLTYTRIVSPITGRAGAIAVKAGNLVKDNDTTLVTVLQMSPIYVSFGLPEQTLNAVRAYAANHPLEVQSVNGEGKSEAGTLRFIDNTVDATTGTIKLKASFPNVGRSLWPGEFVNVQARLNVEHDRILVPSRTIQTGPQGKYVWVMQGDTASMRPVDVLRLYQPPNQSEQAVIGNGLKPGEMVISEGQLRLMPGAKVRLLKQENQQLGAISSDSGPGAS